MSVTRGGAELEIIRDPLWDNIRLDRSALLPFEMPLLTALTVNPPPHAFDYQVRALQFSPGRQGRQHVQLT